MIICGSLYEINRYFQRGFFKILIKEKKKWIVRLFIYPALFISALLRDLFVLDDPFTAMNSVQVIVPPIVLIPTYSLPLKSARLTFLPFKSGNVNSGAGLLSVFEGVLSAIGCEGFISTLSLVCCVGTVFFFLQPPAIHAITKIKHNIFISFILITCHNSYLVIGYLN